jgi:DNA gyrase/topoisomerase IV subunit B
MARAAKKLRNSRLTALMIAQVSFVNSIATSKGGTHVNAITDQVCEKVMAIVQVAAAQSTDPRMD